jgi:hypothetical protein
MAECKLCGCDLAIEMEVIDGDYRPRNMVYSKDKSKHYYLCDRCKRIFIRTRNQVTKFIQADIFWSE